MSFANQLYPDEWRTATAMLARSPQAILISGIEGLGKFKIALELANWLLCQKNHPNFNKNYQTNNLHKLESISQDKTYLKACGECGSCKLFNSREHMDLQILYPNNKKGILGFWWGDYPLPIMVDENQQPVKQGADSILVDNIRGLDRFVNQSSFYGGFRVVIIWPAQMMNKSAANALLKNLEEPTPNLIYILVCDHLDQMLPTIISRCRKLNVLAPDVQESFNWIQEQTDQNLDPDQKQISTIIDLTEGLPIQALRWIKHYQIISKLQTNLDESKGLKMMELAEEISEYINPKSIKNRQSQLIDHQITLSDLLTLLQKIINQKLIQKIKSGVKTQKLINWFEIDNELIFFKKHLIYNLNPRQVLTKILLKIALNNK